MAQVVQPAMDPVLVEVVGPETAVAGLAPGTGPDQPQGQAGLMELADMEPAIGIRLGSAVNPEGRRAAMGADLLTTAPKAAKGVPGGAGSRAQFQRWAALAARATRLRARPGPARAALAAVDGTLSAAAATLTERPSIQMRVGSGLTAQMPQLEARGTPRNRRKSKLV